MSIPYTHHMKVYVGRQKNGEFKVAYFDEQQISQLSFSGTESLKSYLARVSEIRNAHIEIYDGAPNKSKYLFKDEDVDRIPVGEFLPIVKGLDKKCREGRVDVVLV